MDEFIANLAENTKPHVQKLHEALDAAQKAEEEAEWDQALEDAQNAAAQIYSQMDALHQWVETQQEQPEPVAEENPEDVQD